MKSALIIETFIKNFNYLNKNKRRNGFNLFNNTQLTYELESIALDLQQDLEDIPRPSLSDSKQTHSFYTFVAAAFIEAKEMRSKYAPEIHCYESQELFGRENGIVIDRDYKIPYKSGKFEQQLIIGLQAVITLVNTMMVSASESENHWLVTLNDNCEKLAKQISEYNPEEIITADRSIIP